MAYMFNSSFKILKVYIEICFTILIGPVHSIQNRDKDIDNKILDTYTNTKALKKVLKLLIIKWQAICLRLLGIYTLLIRANFIITVKPMSGM